MGKRVVRLRNRGGAPYLRKVRARWRAEALADPEIRVSLSVAALLLDLLYERGKDRARFHRFLRETGVGDHPEFMRCVIRAARAIVGGGWGRAMTDQSKEMVERVAEAIFLKEGRAKDVAWEDVVKALALMPNWSRGDKPPLVSDYYRAIARAAIEAMEEPTDAMIRASTALVPTWDDDASRRKWDAMIAAALK